MAGEVASEEYTTNALSARELEWAVNSEELLQQLRKANGSIVRTRFPPEPNGYLHVGHAKSMNMNLHLAFEKLGVAPENRRTIFRYDDTNPDAESEEYIDSLKRDVAYLGWTPETTTYSSDNFQTLYELAVTLIQKGKAYCCDMTKGEMETQRELAKKPSLGGKVVIKFTIAKDGSVSRASKKTSTMGSAAVEQCIVGRFKRMKFPTPKGGGIVIVSYPFIFSPG